MAAPGSSRSTLRPRSRGSVPSGSTSCRLAVTRSAEVVRATTSWPGEPGRRVVVAVLGEQQLGRHGHRHALRSVHLVHLVDAAARLRADEEQAVPVRLPRRRERLPTRRRAAEHGDPRLGPVDQPQLPAGAGVLAVGDHVGVHGIPRRLGGPALGGEALGRATRHRLPVDLPRAALVAGERDRGAVRGERRAGLVGHGGGQPAQAGAVAADQPQLPLRTNATKARLGRVERHQGAVRGQLRVAGVAAGGQLPDRPARVPQVDLRRRRRRGGW